MTHYWNDIPPVEAFLQDVERVLLSTVDMGALPIASHIADLVRSGGKMLRPALVYIGSEFALAGKRKAVFSASQYEKLVHLAAALELLHTATLVHDDILDRADTRRGMPSLHRRLGTAEAILAGDWLFARTFKLVTSRVRQEHAMLLADFVAAICKAEIMQDMHKFHFDTTRRTYHQTIAGKTAALFSLSLSVGAAELNCPASLVQSLRRTGYSLGMAFQILDDVLDYVSTQEAFKKPVGNDLHEGLCTLPLILALEENEETLVPLLAQLRDSARQPGTSQEEFIEHIVEIVQHSNGPARAREEARRYTERAHRELERLPACSGREHLALTLDRLLVRTY
ncbi:MAG: polyprenyl synthetase family protein [Spirochaetaceae bacterium]|nr:polyprenyl synthetase family protein [Spirochaetaceae bacterium]